MTTWNLTLTDENNQIARIDSAEFVKGIIQAALQKFLEAEMDEYIGAERYERSDERTGFRNGTKPRTLHLKVGTVCLRLPQARDGGFHTELFERYQRSERAFTLAIVEMWQNGVSSRKVSEITDALCGISFSKSTVSELCKSLDGQVSAWKARDLSEYACPYVFVDALYENVRKGGRVVREGVLIVTAVRSDGMREILDMAIADTESESSYNDLFSSLRRRGLFGVRLVTSDAHAGLKAAISRYFQGASWQRCQIHFMRDVLGKAPLKYREKLSADIRAVFNEADRDKAMNKAKEAADRWRDTCGRAADMIEDSIEQCLSVLAFPAEHQTHIRTNNVLERLNKEIRRRDRVIEIFPNEASMLRLIGSLLIEQSEEWISGTPYLEMGLLPGADAPVPLIEVIGHLDLASPRKAS